MGFWKNVLILCGIDFMTGGKVFDGRKGGIGYGWFIIFIILFFPFWLIYKIFKLIFGKNK